MNRVTVATAGVVAIFLATFASVIAIGQSQTRHRSVNNFRGRATTTAAFVADYVKGVAASEKSVAAKALATNPISQSNFSLLNTSFGFSAAVDLDNKGRVVAVSPPAPKLIGTQLATRYAHLMRAEAGRVAVSNVVPSAVEHQPVIAVAVPYATPQGRHVYSGAFAVARTPLGQYLAHVVVSKTHDVFLVDTDNKIIASSPGTTQPTVNVALPNLGDAMIGKPTGSFTNKGALWSFVSAPVAGTQWQIVVSEPNAVLYSATQGLSGMAPWLVFGASSVLALLVGLLFLRLVIDRRSLSRLSTEMATAAETDELTGLANRRRLVSKLADIAKGGREDDQLISVLMIDLDKFKNINDTYGHDVGDRTLIAVAEAMRTVFRVNDTYGRWGGDEFLAILPSTSPSEASEIGERFRIRLMETKVHTGNAVLTIAASVGVSSGLADVDDMLRRADVALYRAKDDGGLAINAAMNQLPR